MTDVSAETFENAPEAAETPEQAQARRKAAIVAEASARAKATLDERETAAAMRAVEASGYLMRAAMAKAEKRFPGYRGLSPDVAQKVVAAADDIRRNCGNAAKAMIEEGIKLMEIRDLPEMKGCFLAWLHAQFSMSRRTAYRLMRAAEHYQGHRQRLAKLANHPFSVLYKLISPSVPDTVRDEVESRAAAGERFTFADIEQMVREAAAGERFTFADIEQMVREAAAGVNLGTTPEAETVEAEPARTAEPAVIDLPSSEFMTVEPEAAEIEPEAAEIEPEAAESEPVEITEPIAAPTGTVAHEILAEQQKARAMRGADALAAAVEMARSSLVKCLDLPRDDDIAARWAAAREKMEVLSEEIAQLLFGVAVLRGGAVICRPPD